MAGDRSLILRALHEGGAHLVVCGNDKVAKLKGWQDSPASLTQALYADNVGLIPASLGLFVIDVDIPADLKGTDEGKELAKSRAKHVVSVTGNTSAVAVDTPSGGLHLVYKMAADVVERFGANKKLPGIGDVRCARGYIVLWDAKRVLDAFRAEGSFLTSDQIETLLASLKPVQASSQLDLAGAEGAHPDMVAAIWKAVGAGLPVDRQKWVAFLLTQGKNERTREEAEAEVDSAIRSAEGKTGNGAQPNIVFPEGEVFPNFGLPEPEVPNTGGSDTTVSEEAEADPEPVIDGAPLGEGLFAKQFLDAHGENMRHDGRRSDRTGAWVVWSKGRWVRREHPPHTRMMVIIRNTCAEAEKPDKATATWDRSSTRTGSLKIVAERCERRVWDTDPNLLGLADGQVVDVNTGEIRTQLRDDHITQSTGILPADTEGEFPAVVLEICQGDERMVGFVEAVAVDCAIGQLGSHMVPIFHGRPGTGKTTIWESVRQALGTYAKAVGADRLMVEQVTRHPAWLANLADARMVVASELTPGAVWNAPLVCQMTGGDTISAHFMRENPFDFTPRFRLVMLANDLPEIPSANSGLRRRVKVIPFKYEVGAAKDEDILEYFSGEGRGEVLRWLLNRCAEVNGRDKAARYPFCPRIEAATAAYVEQRSDFDKWADTHLAANTGSSFSVVPAFASYDEWRTKTGSGRMTEKGFRTALKRRMSPLQSERRQIDGQRDTFYDGWLLVSG